MLIPLIWFLIYLGNMFNLSPEFIQDKWVYLSPVESVDAGTLATACSPAVSPRQCDALPNSVPDGTVVLYPNAWRSGIIEQQHYTRHEIEHLLRIEDHSLGSTFDEKSVEAVACAEAPMWVCFR